MTVARHPIAAAAVLAALWAGSVHAQQPPAKPAPAKPAPAAQAAPAQPPADPVVATVDGEQIRLSDVREAMASLPAQAQQMPPQQVYPFVLDQVIDAKLLVREAKAAGVDKDAQVQRQMTAAADRALQSAFLHREIDPKLTDEAMKARFDKEYSGKAGEQEVHARHILVGDEATAKKLIADLKKGGDFAALSKQYSKDPGASEQGGDLGFFKKSDMVPEFATAAFGLKDGEITPSPVKTQFGWHVIQRIEHRLSPPPNFDDIREELSQRIVQEAVQATMAKAKANAKIEKFNIDGSQRKATDMAEPPAPAK